MRCTGDSSLMCGASWIINVYKIDGAHTELPAMGELKLDSCNKAVILLPEIV